MKSKVRRLQSRARCLVTKFEQGGGSNFINEAILLDREALKLCPSGHRKRSVSLTLLAIHLWHRFNELGSTADLEEAIEIDREALALRPPGHPCRMASLKNLALDLYARYNWSRAVEDLEEIIVLDREALFLCPPGHQDRPAPLNNLAIHLTARYNQLGMMEDLKEAIVLDREALELRPQGHEDRSMFLNNLAVHLSTRYYQLGAMEDLEEAIILDREALTLRPPGHPDRPMSLSNLAIRLSTRYEQIGAARDLEDAVALNRDALDLCPPEHPDRLKHLNSLALSLSTRYNNLKEIEDLEEAIVLAREAMELCPPGHPDYSMVLTNLAVDLSTRYEQLKVMEDLEEAIDLSREGLGLHPPGHPARSVSLNSLANRLYVRYEQLWKPEDLEEAISLDKEALMLRPQGHPARPKSLGNLAIHVFARYNLLGGIDDLNEAVALGRDALVLRPPGHPDRLMSLNNLAIHLSARYKQLGETEDIEAAIVIDREALELCPESDPERLRYLNNLAVDLATRYYRLDAIEDLEEAILLDKDVLALCPPGHPTRPIPLSNLTRHLSTRYNRLGDVQDREELYRLYLDLTQIQTVSSIDISAANAWINAAEDHDHPTKLLAYETSLRLLTHHLATLPSLSQRLGVARNATLSLAVDAFSACIRSRSPFIAVELVEQGLSLCWSQLSPLCSPLEEVIVSSPTGKTLANKFMLLATFVYDAFGAGQHDRLCHLQVELQRVINDIRALPGHSRFLLLPIFSDLQQAAREGPVVVVNGSKHSCDALVVFADRDPAHIPLPITIERVEELYLGFHSLMISANSVNVTRDLAIILRELWEDVVSPILDVLLPICPRHSRIWWCPNAEFSLLPLHAAGPYRKGQPNLADIYISSYTATLTSLIHARRPNPAISGTHRKHFVAIGYGKAGEEEEFASVNTELTSVCQRVKRHAAFTQIEGPDSCVSSVTEELRKNDWVHVACHSVPNPGESFESAFALHDGRLTVEHIAKCELVNPEFAFLSTRHATAVDDDNPDEVVHVAAALHFAGFRSVIGTMWAVDGGEANKVAAMFYENMVDESGRLDHTRAALALHKTMRDVEDVPLDQRILYVHFGA